MRRHAHTVIVGAGIVGCSAAYFLAKGGMTDVVVIDRGPLFRTGGSTSHAPGLVFQNNASRTVSKLAQWTVETYLDVSADGEPCYFPASSVEVATTEARWADLHRKVGFARSWGIDASLLSPDETVQQVPLINPDRILGAIHVRHDGVARAVTIAGRLAKRAEALGVEFVGDTIVTVFDIRDGRVRGITTSMGHIEAERVLICGGIWGPLLGEMAGVPIPLQPCAHPYVRTAPIPELCGVDGIVQPIVRHQDASMYLWQEGERIGIGSYRHEPKLVSPAVIRDEPTAELPFDDEKMAFGRREAARLMPALRGHGVTDRVYGMFSFTPDAQSLIGEVASVRGLWLGEAIWVTHGAGAGRAIADLMLTGACDLDLREVDPNRFAPHVADRTFVEIRGAQNYREVYDVIHPRQQIERPRGLRRAPWYDRQREIGAHFFESNGWERAHWYEANVDLPRPVAGASRTGWSAVEWSPIAAAEHRATRERVSLFDLATFMKIEVSGPNALPALERLSCSDVDRPVGRVAYALLLNQSGGIESDLTITRLESDRFLILAGSASGPRDLAWIQRHTRDLDGVEIRDVTSAWCGLGLWGPEAPDILSALVDDDLAERAFPPYAARRIFVAGIPCLALRLSYVGEDGWEVHVPTEYGGALWDALWEAGRPRGLIAAGNAAMDSLRLERGFRALGTDLRAEFTPHEAGLSFAVTRRRDSYIGHAALAKRATRCHLSCLLLDDASVVLTANEPILADGVVVGHVTSASFGYTIGRSIAYGYLPVELAQPGARLQIESFGVCHTAVVAAEPLYDRRVRPDARHAVHAAAAR
ncbi:MAG: GcvT family protein [Thermomicrobiales bacterium]